MSRHVTSYHIIFIYPHCSSFSHSFAHFLQSFSCDRHSFGSQFLQSEGSGTTLGSWTLNSLRQMSTMEFWEFYSQMGHMGLAMGCYGTVMDEYAWVKLRVLEHG